LLPFPDKWSQNRARPLCRFWNFKIWFLADMVDRPVNNWHKGPINPIEASPQFFFCISKIHEKNPEIIPPSQKKTLFFNGVGYCAYSRSWAKCCLWTRKSYILPICPYFYVMRYPGKIYFSYFLKKWTFFLFFLLVSVLCILHRSFFLFYVYYV